MAASFKSRLLSLLAGAALMAGCQNVGAVWAEAPALTVSAAACQLDPDPYYRSARRAMQVDHGNASLVRDTCDALIAHPGRISASDLINALYYSGAANRILSTTQSGDLTPDAARSLREAERLLDRALALSDNFHLARLERARVYRLQARLSGSQAPNRRALNEVEELQRNIPDPGDPIHAAAHYLRASIFIDQHAGGPTREEAEAAASARQVSSAAHEDTLPTLTWDSTLHDLAVFTDAAHAWSREHREHPDRNEALRQLALYGNQLACHLTPCLSVEMVDTWHGAPRTRENVQRGVDYLSLAQSAVDAASSPDYAHPQFAATYTNLGIAKTQLAGLLSPRADATFGCVPDVGNEAMLNQAKSDLEVALRRAAPGSDDQRAAQLALACTQLALGDVGDAHVTASAAVQTESAASWVMYARVLAAQQQWSDAAARYGQAAGLASTEEARSIIHLERARVFLAAPPQDLVTDEALETSSVEQRQAAVEALLLANPTPRGNLLARLELGKLYQTQQLFSAAQAQLTTFEAGHEAASYDDRAARAQALLFLSRARADLGRGDEALRNADDAFALDGAWPYREQACLVRIKFGRVAFSQTGPRAICGPSEDAPPGEGYLLEGMYHLRRAFPLRAGDREREWEDAYRAFDQGAAAVEQAVVSQALRDRLQYGRGTAQFCIGFSEIGNAAIQAIGGDASESEAAARIDAARRYFAHYGVADCPARR